MTPNQMKVLSTLCDGGWMVHAIYPPGWMRHSDKPGRTISIQRRGITHNWVRIPSPTFDSLVKHRWIEHVRTDNGNDCIFDITTAGLIALDIDRATRG